MLGHLGHDLPGVTSPQLSWQNFGLAFAQCLGRLCKGYHLFMPVSFNLLPMSIIFSMNRWILLNFSIISGLVVFITLLIGIGVSLDISQLGSCQMLMGRLTCLN